MTNQEIRERIKELGLKQWQVADACGIGESTLVRWFRHELSNEQKIIVLKAIHELKKRNELKQEHEDGCGLDGYPLQT